MPYSRTDTLAPYGGRLVCHDLRNLAQSICSRWLYGDAEVGRVRNRRCHLTYDDGGVRVRERVALNDYCGSRLAIVAGGGDCNDVTATSRHRSRRPLQSNAAHRLHPAGQDWPPMPPHAREPVPNGHRAAPCVPPGDPRYAADCANLASSLERMCPCVAPNLAANCNALRRVSTTGGSQLPDANTRIAGQHATGRPQADALAHVPLQLRAFQPARH